MVTQAHFSAALISTEEDPEADAGAGREPKASDDSTQTDELEKR